MTCTDYVSATMRYIASLAGWSFGSTRPSFSSSPRRRRMSSSGHSSMSASSPSVRHPSPPGGRARARTWSSWSLVGYCCNRDSPAFGSRLCALIQLRGALWRGSCGGPAEERREGQTSAGRSKPRTTVGGDSWPVVIPMLRPVAISLARRPTCCGRCLRLTTSSVPSFSWSCGLLMPWDKLLAGSNARTCSPILSGTCEAGPAARVLLLGPRVPLLHAGGLSRYPGTRPVGIRLRCAGVGRRSFYIQACRIESR